MAGRKKVIVAVHGIGEQFRYATAQQVVNRFCGYYHEAHPSAVPLGALYHTPRPVPAPYPFPKDSDLGFEEVYWAPIPRKEATDGFVIEEAKAWARTVVARIGAETDATRLTHFQYQSIRTILEEIIEAIAVLERLSFIAEKAGVLEFELGQVLVDFIGDVQIVTEFETFREAILQHFDKVMTDVAKSAGYEDADIYVVSHSEGTVVALLGLLRAFCPRPGADGKPTPPPAWAARVKGFMTLGSPIDKHLVLWPRLWEEFEAGPTALPPAPIPWKNYYDNGDPVGFDLDVAREWMGERWSKVFHFTKEDDHGFTRYYLPGKAHVDYWEDPAVFGHFIANVVERDLAAPDEAAAARRKRYAEGPRTRLGALVTSYLLPYAVVLGLMFLASFLIYKTVYQSIDAAGHARIRSSVPIVFRKVGAMTLLLFGITAGARMVFLTRLKTGFHWWLAGALIFAACAAGYYELNVGKWLGERAAEGGFPSSQSGKADGRWPAAVVVFAAAGVCFAGAVASKLNAKWGLRALLILGAGSVAAVVMHLEQAAKEEMTLWPVVLAGVASLYLWWLSILVFDLTFVWHRYIRHARTLGFLAELWRKRERRAGR
jgi:hypothetical protein